ncbi:MAG: nucleoside-diphosphate-sugar epimerase [Hyphomicrobiaceae bacterium]|jgi:nucleoside-diphosphate-sugar epimerase
MSDTSPKTALIAGATGAASKRLVEVLLADPNWSVIGLSRNPPESPHDRLRYVRADLLDPKSVTSALDGASHITHAFYTSRAPFKEGGVEDVPSNRAMVKNMIDALETVSPGNLGHIHLVEGSKWYGVHAGPSPSPAREDAARHMPPNFYYDQEDLLSSRQHGQRWSWSASRPNVIYDFAPDRTRNIVPTLGVWAAMSKEMGIPLDFPGKNFENLSDMTDAVQLANAMKWMSTSKTAENQAFNVTDGDFFRWRQLFKRIADHFEIELGQARPMNVERWMADKEPLWNRIVDRHSLKPTRLENLAAWGFADFLFNQTFDVVSSMIKIRQAGFHDTRATEDTFIAHLAQYQAAGILPR